MQTQTKQRIIGILVLLAVIAIFLPLILYHPLSGSHKLKLSAYVPKPPRQPMVYDLPLQAQVTPRVHKLRNARFVQINKARANNLRIGARHTNVILQHIRRSKQPSARNLAKKEKLKISAAQAPNPKITPKQHQTSTADSARDSDLNKVLLQSSMLKTPKAWVVQVASFSDQEHCDRLVLKLRKMGMEAFSKTTASVLGAVHRVYVGPYIKLEKVHALQQQLLKKLHLKGVIKKYTL